MKKSVVTVLFICFMFIPSSICMADDKNGFPTAKKAYEEGKYTEAINYFKKVLKGIEERTLQGQLMPQEDQDLEDIVHNYMGKIYKIQGNYELALNEFNAVDIASDSTNSCASYFLGEIYYLQDEPKYPVEYWKTVIRESFDTECLLYAYVMYYITAKTDGKEENELKEIPWKLKNDKWLQAIINYLGGKNTEKKLMEQALTLPHKVFAAYIIGRKNLDENKPQISKEYFRRAVKMGCKDCIGYDLAKKELKHIEQK